MPLPEGYVSACDYGAKADGSRDATQAIQAAVDHLAELGGGNVWLPPGHYRVEGSIAVRPGVSVLGAHDAPCGFHELTGTVIEATGGRDNEDGPPLFDLRDSSMVRGLTVYWPEQRLDDPRPYPWAFQMQGSDNTVECVTFINAWNGIQVGPEHNCRHRIRSCHGFFLRRGFYVDNTWEIGRIENCQLHPHWWSDKKLGGDFGEAMRFAQEHLDMFLFGRTDWEYVTNNFVFGCKTGYRFIHTKNGEFNGHLTGCGADGSQTAVLVERMQKMGILVTGGEFVSLAGPDPVQVRTAASCDQGSLRFVNSSFWGLSNHVARLEGDCYVSFSDCYLTNWKEGVVDKPLVVADAGKLQVHACSFDAPHPAVRIGAGVRHAIVRGNNGHRGVRVENNAGDRAVINDNEPPQAIEDPLAHMPEPWTG
jgi:hypothetical protein